MCDVQDRKYYNELPSLPKWENKVRNGKKKKKHEIKTKTENQTEAKQIKHKKKKKIHTNRT